MKNQYELNTKIDLSLDDVQMSDKEEYFTISRDLQPTEAMQSRFIQNCVDLGVLIKKVRL